MKTVRTIICTLVTAFTCLHAMASLVTSEGGATWRAITIENTLTRSVTIEGTFRVPGAKDFQFIKEIAPSKTVAVEVPYTEEPTELKVSLWRFSTKFDLKPETKTITIKQVSVSIATKGTNAKHDTLWPLIFQS